MVQRSGEPRRREVRLGRVNLKGMEDAQRWDTIEVYLNELREVLLQSPVVLPTMSQSANPQNGELLFTGSALYLCVGGQYRQVWPAEAVSVAGGEAVSTTVASLTYPNPRRTIKWSYRDDITPDAPTASPKDEYDLIEEIYDAVTPSNNRHICVVYLSITNRDPNDRTIRFYFDGDLVEDVGGDFDKPYLTTNVRAGTTVTHRLDGSEMIGPLGGSSEQGRFYCTADDDEGMDSMIGLTRYDLIVHVGYIELEKYWVSFSDSRVRRIEQGSDCRDDWTDGVPPTWNPPADS